MDCQSTTFSTKFSGFIRRLGPSEYKLETRKFQVRRFLYELCSLKSKGMAKDSEIREKLREMQPLIMASVIGITLLLAIVIIASLLSLSFST